MKIAKRKDNLPTFHDDGTVSFRNPMTDEWERSEVIAFRMAYSACWKWQKGV